MARRKTGWTPRSEPQGGTWEPEWEEIDAPARRRRAWLPSTRLFVIALGCWIGALALLALGFFGGNSGTNAAVLGFFLVCIVVSTIASAFGTFFAVFGFFRYRRKKILNMLLVLLSAVTNPVVLLWIASYGIAG